MSHGFLRAACLFSVAMVVALGCSETPETPAKPNQAAAPAPAKLKPDVPQTAEATMKAVLDGLKASKPIAVWNTFDDHAQTSINSSIRKIVTTIDPEIWERSVRNLKKLVRLLETKKDDILDSPLWKTTKVVKLQDVKAHWKPAVAILKTVVESELVDQEKMKNFDGKAFFEGTGAKLYGQARELTKLMKDDPLKRLDEMKATVKSSGPETADVSLKSSDPKAKPFNFSLAIHDGRWTAVQAGLLGFVITMQVGPLLSGFEPYALVDWKDDYLKDMNRLEKTLDQLQAAKNSGEFQSIVALQVLPFVAQKVAQFSRPKKPLTPLDGLVRGRKKGVALVIVTGDHFGDEPPMMAMSDLFRHIADEGQGIFSGPKRVETVTVFFVGPVSDTNDLAKKITVGKIATVDVKRNTVTVELPESQTQKNVAADGDSKGASTDALDAKTAPKK